MLVASPRPPGFVADLAGEKKLVNLLPLHDVAKGKDEKLGQKRDLSGLHEPTPEVVQRAIETFANYGLRASVGG